MKEERQHSRFIKLLPPGQENEICDRCKPYAKDGYYHQIHQKAQKYWDSLSKEEKLKAVIRTGGVRMAEFYGETLTAEQLAEQEKAPRSIYEDLVHNQKCGSCGEEPCQDNQRNKNNSHRPQLASSSGEKLEKEELEKKLSEAQKQDDKKEMARLQSELEKLNNRQQAQENKPTKNDKVLIWSVGIFSISALILGGVILIVKRKNKKNS